MNPSMTRPRTPRAHLLLAALCLLLAAALLGGCLPEGSGIKPKADAEGDGSTSGSTSGTDEDGSTSGTGEDATTSGTDEDGSTSGTGEDATTSGTDPDTNTPPDDTSDPDTDEDTTCTPACQDLNLECGTDPICGGSCGTCDDAFDCIAGQCVPSGCVPECNGQECGLDPLCGLPCGNCNTDEFCADGFCEPNACIPQCGTRECGLDPLCGVSCGDCVGNETCNASGQCESPPNGTPSITALSVSPTTITPSASGTFSATVTDPNGVADISGGTLRDPTSGGTYGTFSGSNGTYTLNLTWNQINARRPIDAAVGGTPRIFEAVFSDAGGNQATHQVTATMSCGANSATCTPGTCTSLVSMTQCGACNNNCESANTSTNDLFVEAIACEATGPTAYCTYDLGQLTRTTCSAACQARGFVCDTTQEQFGGYVAGFCAPPCASVGASCASGAGQCRSTNSPTLPLACVPTSPTSETSFSQFRACSLDADCTSGECFGVFQESNIVTNPTPLTCTQTPPTSIPPYGLTFQGGDWDYLQMFCKCRRP